VDAYGLIKSILERLETARYGRGWCISGVWTPARLQRHLPGLTAPVQYTFACVAIDESPIVGTIVVVCQEFSARALTAFSAALELGTVVLDLDEEQSEDEWW
jgi:hypothetical protein